MSKKIQALLISIVLIASLLRIWDLGNVPLSPDWDEAALGYNAYSILNTGKDEYGDKFPIILRSFDDYKPGLYAYLIIPFIVFFDLNLFIVRLPSVIFGIITVLAVFFLVKELLNKNTIAIASSFLLAISPWHIQFSRIAFESNVGAGLNVLGVLFFLKGLKNPMLLIFSSIFFGLGVHVYQGQKLFVPLLLFVLIFFFREKFFSISKKYLLSSFFVLIIIFLPLIYYSFTNSEAFARARGVSVFSDQTLIANNAQKLLRDIENNDTIGLVLDNRRVEFVKLIMSGYLSHFDLNWLFITGDQARHHAPNMGLMYLWELPFLMIGIYQFVFGKLLANIDRRIKGFLVLWFLIVPIPASLTTGVPHAVRALNFLPIIQIFTGIGLIFALQKISDIKYLALPAGRQILKIQIKYLIFTLCILFFILNFLYYLNQYFVQQNYFHSKEWQYGYKEAVGFVKEVEKKYERIIVSNQPHLDQSYIFFLFYLKYSPGAYLNEGGSGTGGFRENHKFGKYEFRPVDWKEEKKEKTLFVGRSEDFPENVDVVKTINFLDGKPAIKIAEG